MAGVRAVHRWAHRRKADHGSLERRLAFCDLDPHRGGQRLAPPQAPRGLFAPEQLGTDLAQNRADQAHAIMLDWLELSGLRRQATAELNKSEAHNALARAVCFHRLGRLRDRAAEVQHYRASGLALVTAAVVLWNTVYLGPRARRTARQRPSQRARTQGRHRRLHPGP